MIGRTLTRDGRRAGPQPAAPHDQTEQDKAEQDKAEQNQAGETGEADQTDRTDEPERSDQLAREATHRAWRLVAEAQAGDTEAFGELYDLYVDMVYRYVLFRVSDRTLAEDVTSETFLRAFRRISSLSYQGRDVGAWFVTIARNLLFDHVKSSRYRLEVSTAEILESANGATAGAPEHEVVAAAVNTELMRCVDQLNPDQRECVLLRFMHGLSVAETAAAMDRNEGAIKALQHRAVRRLATLLPDDLL